MRHDPRTPGVDVNSVFLFGKLVRRASAFSSGSPLSSASLGSDDNSSTHRHPAGIPWLALPLLPPMIEMIMSPANSFKNIVFAASLALMDVCLALIDGVLLKSGVNRCRTWRLANVSVGNITRKGVGFRTIVAPSQLRPASVLPPLWEPNTITTRLIRVSLGERRSIGSRRNGVRSVRHGPGSELDRLVSTRSASAHWLTVMSGGGWSASRKACR